MKRCTCQYTHGIGYAPYTRDDDCPTHGDRAYVREGRETMSATTYYCPDCRAEVWDGPNGSKLAKCHACGIAFDTIDITPDDPRVTPPRYTVEENTPGYLPEEEEPFRTDDLESARAYLKERVENYCDYLCEGYEYADDYEPEVFWTRDLDYACVTDPRRTHDLGRVFEILATDA